MDIFFTDPNEVPLPPDEMRIRALRAEVWPDGRRVKVSLEVEPFQKRPNLEISILNVNGQEIAHTSIIESIERHIEMTLHLRGADLSGPFSISAVLFYTDIEEQLDPETEPRPIERPVMDQKSAEFDISTP